MATKRLTERERAVLSIAVRLFIATGEPVSSRAVCRNPAMAVSAATVRSVMAALEARGMLVQPHTSAGRVPTVEAMRLYVSRLVSPLPVAEGDARRIQAACDGQQGVDALIQQASGVLSAISSMAGLASPPSAAVMKIRRIELVVLDETRALVVLVTEGAQVRHQVVPLAQPVSGAQLVRMQNWLNETVAGLTLVDARRRLEEEVRREKIRYDQMVRRAVAVGRHALQVSSGEVVLEGELNFLKMESFGDLDRARRVLEALREKRALLAILDRLRVSRGAQVLVGLGEGEVGLVECSLIAAPYMRRGMLMGWVGIVGPVRMHYRRLMPLVETAAGVVSARLEATVAA